MEDNKNDSLSEKIAKQRQAANEQNEIKTGRSKSALTSANQKITVPKQQEFDKEGWEKVQAEKQKKIDDKVQKPQDQKSQQQQSRHSPSAKQNFKEVTTPKTIEKEPSSPRSGFRSGGSPMMRESDEIIKEKHKNTNPEDILSQKDKKPVITNPQQKQEQQQQQSKHQANPAQTFKPSAIKSKLDELPKDLVNTEKALATLKAVNAKQMNPENSVKTPIGKEKTIQIAENKVKSQTPKSIKR